MLNGKKIVVVLPAYNAELTLRQTYREIPLDIVDDVILVDDHSSDATASLSEQLGIKTFIHPANLGYGANQKTCYRQALKLGADIVVMLHPDYQYSPRLITAMASLVSVDHYDLVLGSRILGVGALAGGMPYYKYVSNRVLTLIQNLLIHHKLSEYHTGYRSYSRRVLETIPFESNSDDFVFDNQVLAQAVYFGFRIGEISCPTAYFPEASSINLRRSIVYGLGVIWTSVKFVFNKAGLIKSPLFQPKPPDRPSSKK